uniref:Iron-containing alcohol dehydrogenase n=1 Tax=candidate division WOR-3 bacterium TaxID=2052148 RepID=A0A7C6AAC6_UNCW3
MALIFRNIEIPLFLEIEPDILLKFPVVIRKNNLYYRKPLIVSGSNTWQVAGETVVRGFRQLGMKTENIIVKSNTIEQVNRVREKIRASETDVIIGVGGGRVIDVGKFAASLERVNFFSVPTAPSHDGIASPIAVIKEGDKLVRYGARMPVGVIIDLTIISRAPKETIYAGFGDLISNLTAVQDWEIACKMGKERFDSFAASIAETQAQAIMSNIGYSPLRQIGFLKKLVTGLVMSGIAMAIAGSSRPSSGAEHIISHALDRLLPKPLPHGIQVGIATIFTCALQGGPWWDLKQICQRIGFPVSPNEVNIPKSTFLEAVAVAPKLRQDRFTILNKIRKERYLEIYDKVYSEKEVEKEIKPERHFKESCVSTSQPNALVIPVT